MNRVTDPIAPPSQATASWLTVSNLPRSWPPRASPDSLDHSLQVYLWTRTIMASKFAPSWPPSASLYSLDHGLQLHLQTRSITASKCISKLDRLQPRSASSSSLNHGVVKRWSLKADSPSSTLRRTSHGIRREFMRKSKKEGERIWRDTRPWWTTQMPWIYEWLARVHEDQHKLRGSTKLGKSAWDQELGKIECVCHIMRWCQSTPGSPKYILPVAESISVIPSSPYVYRRRDLDNTCHIMM